MLSGATVLVVEDEYFIALEVQVILEAAGAGLVAIARDTAEALHHSTSGVDLALVSIGPGGNAAIELCNALIAQGVAVVALASDRNYQYGVPGLPDASVVLKPFSDHELVTAAAAALAAARRPS